MKKSYGFKTLVIMAAVVSALITSFLVLGNATVGHSSLLGAVAPLLLAANGTMIWIIVVTCVSLAALVTMLVYRKRKNIQELNDNKANVVATEAAAESAAPAEEVKEEVKEVPAEVKAEPKKTTTKKTTKKAPAKKETTPATDTEAETK